jgi:hypothetical protein
MDAAPMIVACERGQSNFMGDASHAELVNANVARWLAPSDPVYFGNPAVYSTWCDRCECDHGAEPMIVLP